MNSNYKHSSRPISDFVAGTSNSTINGYTSFPGTNVLADVDVYSTYSGFAILMIRPLKFNYTCDLVDLNLSRFAKYQDFFYTTSLAEQSISAPIGTTHISGVLIGGGSGGGAGGGGNNPDIGNSRAGASGGGGGSGAQLFFYKLAYVSTLRVVIGSGGSGGSGGLCVYNTDGTPGSAGNSSTIKYSSGNNVYQANSGGIGNGGSRGTANAHGTTFGTGGSTGNANGAPLHNPGLFVVTTNTGVGGASGNVWDGVVASGGSGGSLHKFLNILDYGNGGDGGTVNGIGAGVDANNSNGVSGRRGFCRIYYLIE